MSQQATEEHAQAATTRVLTLLAAYEARRMTAPDLSRAAAVVVFAGKVLASRVADIFVSTQASAPPLGIRPADDHLERLDAAVSTILAEPDPAPRLERLAASEVLRSGHTSTLAAIREHGFPSWERVAGEDPCEECAPLIGEVQPVGTPFHDHPGCRCGFQPSHRLQEYR